MNAFQTLQAARCAGVEVRVEGDDLILEAAAPPRAEIIELLAGRKAAIIGLLRSEQNGWASDDWLAYFDERAGVAEFDGGMSRPEAEAHAFACCVVEWLSRHPARSSAGRCLGCGQAELAHDPLLPFGADCGDQAWLHSRCWQAWCLRREAESVAALAVMGIMAPAEFPNDFVKNGVA